MKKIVILFVAFFMFGCGAKKTEEKTVNFYMWGGSHHINNFIDEKVSKSVMEKEGITLKRVPVTDIKESINKLIIEKNAGRKNGSIDLIWVNGENFKLLKDSKVITKNISSQLKNVALLKDSAQVKDFGEPILGLEIPWGEAQFNFISRTNDIPFKDSETLMQYIKSNPGRFTYPAVTDFTGSAFVRNMAIDILGYENVEKMTTKELEESLGKVWSYFKEMKPYLWRQGETYPESEGRLDTLLSSGEVDVAMGYTINKVSLKVKTGEFPETAKSFLLDKGTLFNNHYLAIPDNSPNKKAALALIDYLISPEGQLLKQNPENWGDLTVIDLDKLDNKVKAEFNKIMEDPKVPEMSELKNKRVGELSPEKTKIIDRGWIENIGKM
ncbi:MAG: ABC transporter substrate-binding protein [Fusobacteriaceae bacterium]